MLASSRVAVGAAPGRNPAKFRAAYADGTVLRTNRSSQNGVSFHRLRSHLQAVGRRTGVHRSCLGGGFRRA